MNEIKIFNSKEFGDVRTVTINGEPWFVGKDVAAALGYVKTRNALTVHVSEEDKKDAPFQGPLGGTQTMIIINESGLYALIFGSKLESAQRFKHWVTSEVLPAIRKTGSYQAPQGKELLALAVLEAQKTIEAQNAEIERMRELGIREDELDLVHHDRKNTEDGYIDTYSMVYTNLIAVITHELQLEKERRSKLELEVVGLRSELDTMRDNLSGNN